MFDLLAPKVTETRLATWLPEAVGLVTAACVAWLTCPRHASHLLSLFELTKLATGYVLLSTLAGLAGCLVTVTILARALGPVALLSRLRSVAAIVWLPPLALFLSQRSVWACLASIAAAWQVANLFLRPAPGKDLDTGASPFRTFGVMDSFAAVPSFQALGSAVSAHSSLWMSLLGYSAASAASLGIGSSLLAWSLNKFRIAPETVPGGPMPRTLLLLAFSITFTLAGLLQAMLGGGAGGAAGQSGDAARNASRFVGGIGGDYTGVILLSEPAQHPLFVLPRPSIKSDLSQSRPDNPMSVPFTGVYWMFRWPYTKPPPNSYVARRSPLESGFRTSDGAPLSMEAHQNFGKAIDLSCCSKIQLSIRSADQFATLGLVLTNTILPGAPSLSLGRQEVASTSGRRPSDGASPTQAIVSFDVPSHPSIRAFDEATIVFNPAFARASAKVEIDRFVFVPRQ